MTIPLATGAPVRSGGGRGITPLAAAAPSAWRTVLAVALVVPGGLLILAGLALVWAGLAPLLPWLSRRQPVQPETPGEPLRAAPVAASRPPAEPGLESTQERREPRPHPQPFLVVQREHEA